MVQWQTAADTFMTSFAFVDTSDYHIESKEIEET